MMKEMIEKIDLRSTGLETKKRAYQVQFLSSVFFISFAIILFFKELHLSYVFLFLFEGIGQILLAAENVDSLKKGDLKVVYFRQNQYGLWAIILFGPVLLSRYLLISELFIEFKYLILAFAILQYLWAIVYFKMAKGRKDMALGSLFFFSSFFLGLAVLSYSANTPFAINQLLYAALIGGGALFLKIWVAEFINILLWVHLFYVLGFS